MIIFIAGIGGIGTMASFHLQRIDDMMKGKKLIMHFDINKTIIITDPVSGISTSSMVNSILTECTWGLIREPHHQEETDEGKKPVIGDWVMYSDIPSTDPPIIANDDASERELVTLGHFLEFHAETSRTERKALKTTFTETPLGAACRPHYDELISKLKFSEKTLSTLGDGLPAMYNDGNYHIIPAFFNLLIELDSRGWDFNVVFRTFGVDISKVASEFNMFCEGLHPLYPTVRMDGTAKCLASPSAPSSIDRRIKFPFGTARLNRWGPAEQDVILSIVNEENVVDAVQGAFNIQDVIEDRVAMSTNSIAVRDDFTWWSRNSESPTSGKMILVDPEPSSRIIQMFFDDNIERNGPHIVDVRNRHTFEEMPFEETDGKYIKRVEPYSAIMDDSYYIKEVLSMAAKYLD